MALAENNAVFNEKFLEKNKHFGNKKVLMKRDDLITLVLCNKLLFPAVFISCILLEKKSSMHFAGCILHSCFAIFPTTEASFLIFMLPN